MFDGIAHNRERRTRIRSLRFGEVESAWSWQAEPGVLAAHYALTGESEAAYDDLAT